MHEPLEKSMQSRSPGDGDGDKDTLGGGKSLDSTLNKSILLKGGEQSTAQRRASMEVGEDGLPKR